MASIKENRAAWQKAEGDRIFAVSDGPDHSQPADDEVVIKVHYVAINPSEWKMQETPYKKFDYPWIFGSDAAGEVALIGKNVTRFKVGDRVTGHFLGLSYGTAKHGSFQQYATTREQVVAKLPDNIDYAHGAVLPLAVSTSTVGLFDVLKLSPANLGKKGSGTVLIWGAGSSVASIGIQLAVAAGYEVITTARAENFAYAKSLGAKEVFDYRTADVEDQIKKALSGHKLVGAFDCVGEEKTTLSCARILESINGGGKIATVLWPPAKEILPKNIEVEISKLSCIVALKLADKIIAIATFPGMLDDYANKAIWEKFVPEALANGALIPKPEPFVVKGGVEKIQEAVDLQKKGVSASKIVVEMIA